VSRAYSHYWMTVRRGREPLDFAAALAAEPVRLAGDHLARSDYSYASRGRYGAQVERYLKLFPREQMLFLLSDDLKRRPEETLARVYAFLGLSPVRYTPISDEEAHQAYMPISRGFQGLLEERSRLKRLGKALLPSFVRRPLMDLMYRLQEHNRRPFATPPLDQALRARLATEFAPDLRRLQQLTGCDLGHWLAPAAAPATPLAAAAAS